MMQQPVERRSFGNAVDQHITTVLKEKGFTLSAEIIPPRNGEDQQTIMNRLQTIVDSGVDFLSVTKGAGGSLRGGSLPIAQAIKDHFTRPCIAHFTCRDLVPQEIENLLIDHHYFGIRNILALRGDPPMGQEEWESRPGGYSYAYELIGQIRKMNEGQFLQRKGFETDSREKTDFCIGCAVYPEHPDQQERMEFAKIKFSEGAEYGITQMIFSPEVYGDFMSMLVKANIKAPIIPGVRILRSQKQADVMKTRFGCDVPDWYRNQLPPDHKNSNVKDEDLLAPFVEMLQKMKKLGAPGAHIFVLNDVELCEKAMKILGDKLR